MNEIQPSSTVGLLGYLQSKLELQFGRLRDARAEAAGSPPVFALEHSLTPDELAMLNSAVRAAVSAGLHSGHRKFWLPFVVYASEIGYRYEGDEYWETFAEETPRWDDSNRHRIKAWFVRFASEFGGAEPRGAWAAHFTIIAWPITHAVLPVYLQRQFAELLFGFRTEISADLLQDPQALGERLAARAHWYSDRFRVFAQNSALLGQVAAAVLLGDEEESPYLTRATLDRVVDGLSHERQAREWLKSAQREAGNRIRGSSPRRGISPAKNSEKRVLLHPTDPRFLLKWIDGAWQAYATLPDLTEVSGRLPPLYAELRTRRAKVTGGSRPVPRGGLVYGGQEVRFVSWPDPEAPFVCLEGSTTAANALLADQCVMTPGPWLYKRDDGGIAVELKRHVVRPGHSYVLVGTSGRTLDLPGCRFVPLQTLGASAQEFTVPEPITDSDRKALAQHGIETTSTLAIRPVGISAGSWDGEGSAEWFAGETVILGVSCDFSPERLLLTFAGEPYVLDWQAGETETFLALDDLALGVHALEVSPLGHDTAQGQAQFTVTIREVRSRLGDAADGEGIRMVVSPARPTLTELWDVADLESRQEPCSVSILGAENAKAELVASLRDGRGITLCEARRTVRLPVEASAWPDLARSIKGDKAFSGHYDDADSCVLEVGRDGLGFASLIAERGFRPLRWRFSTGHDKTKTAQLSDRTDSDNTTVEFFSVITPLTATRYPPVQKIALPANGGLLRATTSDFEVLSIAPTEPNGLWQAGGPPSWLRAPERSVAVIRTFIEGSRMWFSADLPADPFAASMRFKVLEAIARTNASLIGGRFWSAVERKWAIADDPGDCLDELQAAIGTYPHHVRLARGLGTHLHEWTTWDYMVDGFGQVVAETLVRAGLPNETSTVRLLLAFAERPGALGHPAGTEEDGVLEGVMKSPVLLRAARFAVLGSRVINGPDLVETWR